MNGEIDPTPSIHGEDENRLAELGYKQELTRNWSLLHNFGVSFSIIVRYIRAIFFNFSFPIYIYIHDTTTAAISSLLNKLTASSKIGEDKTHHNFC